MKTKILSILTGIILLPFALIVGGRIPYFLLYVYTLSIVIPLIHCLMGKALLRGNIKMPSKDVMTGEEINIRYEIENIGIISFVGLEVENTIAQKLTGISEKTKIVSLAAKESTWKDTVVACRRRGIYEVGDIKIQIRDIFNLFSISKIIKTPIALKVYPQITPLRNLLMDKKQDFYALSDLREYREGDHLRKIHWKASAKKDNLMVKNYEEWGEEDVVIILDSTSRSYQGDEERWIEDKAVETALSIAHHFLENNGNVTLYYQKDNKTQEITGNHYGYLKVFMEELVDFQPKGSNEFHQYVGEIASSIKAKGMLFLVTPLLDKKLGAQGIKLKMKNQLRCVVLGDAEKNPLVWQENKKVGKILQQEDITTYLIDHQQDIRNIMEEGYSHGA